MIEPRADFYIARFSNIGIISDDIWAWSVWWERMTAQTLQL